MLIAVDGPLASGKGTLARRLAAHYGLPYLDTGLLYRATARDVLARGLDPHNAANAVRAAGRIDIATLDDPDLRAAHVGGMASVVAAHPGVRVALLDLQRDFAHQSGGAVLDGRDIGTVICPEADLKLWVEASQVVRAHRRATELRARGEEITDAQMLIDLQQRDARDAGRADAPMRMAEDAHLLNTSTLSIDAAFEMARQIVDAAHAELPAD